MTNWKQVEKEFDEKFYDTKDDWVVNVIGYGKTTRQVKFFYKKKFREMIEGLKVDFSGIVLCNTENDRTDYINRKLDKILKDLE